MTSISAVLVTGARGQLGSDLMAAGKGAPMVGLGSAELDITDAAAVGSAFDAFLARPETAGLPAVVINAAAYTAVDVAESDVERAHLVNGTAPGILAAAAAERGMGFIHVSTDYVFPGDGTQPYQVGDPTGPRSVYGASKLAGEQAVLAAHPEAHVVRTAWVYGVTGGNFVKTMIMLEGSRDTVAVVDDQTGSPTFSADLAAGLLELAASWSDRSVPGGILHATNSGSTTWFGFTREIFSVIGADPARVLPTTTDAFPRPAPRPAYSVMSPNAWNNAGLTPLRPWQDALRSALSEHAEAFRPSTSA